MIVLTTTLSVLLMILTSVALAIALRRRVAIPWWLFLVGAATFVGSQVYHLPLNEWLADVGLIGPVGPDAPDFWRTAVILGLSAGLCESVARAIGYGLLFRFGQAQKREDSLMVGLGHGGIEAMLIGGVLLAATVSSLWVMRGMDLTTLNLPPEQLAAIETQLTLLDGSPLAVFPAYGERLIALALHVFLSVLVWMAFKARQPLYFLAAVGYHSLFDATAVYASQFLETWQTALLILLLALPAFVLLWRWRPAPTARRLQPIRAELRLFNLSLGKELKQQWQTKRLIVIMAVFLLFGMASPLIAYFTPQILGSIEEAAMFADLIPEPTNRDAITQYVGNVTQFGFILAVLLGMGAIAGEKERGLTPMILSKPLPRWAFVLSKFAAQTMVYLLAFALSGLSVYYYTGLLFEPLAFGPFMLGNFLLCAWLLVFAAVTLLGSAIARSTSVAAGIALAGSVAIWLGGSWPKYGALFPSGMLNWAGQLGLETAVAPNAGSLALSFVIILLCLIGAVAFFEVEEL
jgi:ABC-2 type transport system permease protein